MPAPGADPVMAAYAQRLLSHDLGPQASTLDRVRQLVLLLPRGLCSANVYLARKFGLVPIGTLCKDETFLAYLRQVFHHPVLS